MFHAAWEWKRQFSHYPRRRKFISATAPSLLEANYLPCKLQHFIRGLVWKSRFGNVKAAENVRMMFIEKFIYTAKMLASINNYSFSKYSHSIADILLVNIKKNPVPNRNHLSLGSHTFLVRWPTIQNGGQCAWNVLVLFLQHFTKLENKNSCVWGVLGMEGTKDLIFFENGVMIEK